MQATEWIRIHMYEYMQYRYLIYVAFKYKQIKQY